MEATVSSGLLHVSDCELSVGQVRGQSAFGGLVRTLERIAIGAVLIWAVVPKITYPAEFLSDLLSFGVFSYSVAIAIATVLPTLEFILGILLIGGLFRLASSVLCTGLFFSFLGVTLFLWLFRPEASCGCFGAFSNDQVGWGNVVMSAALFMVTMHLSMVELRNRRRTR